MRRLTLSLVAMLGCDDGGSRPVRDVGALGDVAADAGAVDAGLADAGTDAALPDPCAPGPSEVHTLGAWTVEVEERSGAWTVTPPQGGEPVLRSAPACLDGRPRPTLGTTQGDLGVRAAFGGFLFDYGPLEPNLPLGAPTREVDDGLSLTFDLTDGTSARLRFEPFPGGGLRIALEATASGGWLDFACGADEAFFGLGSQVIGPDLRGHRYPLWTQEQGISKPANGQPFPVANIPEAAYAPMGIWHSTAGFSAVIGHDGFSALDLCAGQADRWTLLSHRALPALVLVPGATPKARMTALTDLVGRPSLPPPWAFAPWNDAVGGPAHLRQVAETLRSAGIPSSAIWSEDWIGGEQSNAGFRLSYAWAWDPGTYPNLVSDIEWLHDQGFAFLAYFNPFVPQPTRMWQEGIDGGWLVKDSAGVPISFTDPAFRPAGQVDLTNPEARAWFAGYARTAAAELGIDGWMADFAEWLQPEALMADGRDGWAAHNPYPLAWQALNREVMEAVHADDPRGANDWIFFARSGWASVNGGTAGVAPAMWAGDQNTDWDRDDGLPSVIPIGVHLGLSGVAHFGSDIGGYTSVLNPNTTKELFFRWTSMAAFHPLMRTHHGSDECSNWSFDRDAETLAHFRRYARLHALLYPYFHALALEAAETGVPPVRHPWLVEPSAPAGWREAQDQFYLGDDLLVAPVVTEGATERSVHVGEGWYGLLGTQPGEPAAGAMHPSAVTEIPVFVRPGTILPLLGRVPDTFYRTSAPDLVDLDDLAGWLALGIYPGEGLLRPIVVSGGRVEGGGFTGATDWNIATFNGIALPACGERPCRGPGGRLQVEGPGRLELGSGGAAWLVVPAGRFDVALSGQVFDEATRQPTSLTDLHPDVPPPCLAP